MKKTLFALIVFLTLTIVPKLSNAQAPNWLWAKGGNGNGYNAGTSVATDVNGNIYVTGYFDSASVTFGSFTLNNTNASYWDMFIVKYDPNGNVIWAKSEGSNYNEHGCGITTDINENIYVTGYFTGDSIVFGNTILYNGPGGNPNVFLVKYDSGGNLLWAKSSFKNGDGDNEGRSVATDTNGNVYITGWYTSDTLRFGSNIITNPAGWSNIFISKYDSSGNELWAKGVGGSSTEWASSVCTDLNGNAYLTGGFQSPSISFGSTILTNASSTCSNVLCPDYFIAKYTPNGNVLWARSSGGIDDERGNGIASDASGNVYVTGFFYSPSVTFGSNVLANAGVDDIFITKYDSIGNVLWAKVAGRTGYDEGNSIALDGNGNAYITGWFTSSSVIFASDTLINSGFYDIFILKCDNNGNELWGKSIGGTSWDEGKGITTDINGNMIVTGEFASSSVTFGSTTLTNGGVSKIYIAKLNSTTGIYEPNTFPPKIYFSPNPFSTQTTLWTSEQLRNATLTVDNCFGQTVAQIKNHNGQTITFNRDNLPSGLYFVRLTEENKTIAAVKLIITDK